MVDKVGYDFTDITDEAKSNTEDNRKNAESFALAGFSTFLQQYWSLNGPPSPGPDPGDRPTDFVREDESTTEDDLIHKIDTSIESVNDAINVTGDVRRLSYYGQIWTTREK